MASGPLTQITDVIVPEVFTPYVQQQTEEKSRLIQSGAVAKNDLISGLLAGGGETFKLPSFQDLDNDEENVSTDDADDSYDSGNPNNVNNSVPKKIQTSKEVAVALNRNQSWSSADLAAELIGTDPMSAIASRVATYWARRLQAVFVATVNGVFAQNESADSGDMTFDASGVGFVDGVTNFNAENAINAALTMGDSLDGLSMMMVHSVVYGRMLKNNLIDFIPDANGQMTIATFMGKQVIVDDGMPFNGGVFDTWLFGSGAVQLGTASPLMPTETERKPGAGKGGGQSVLHNRVKWCLHPVGHAFKGDTSSDYGPSNANTSGNLAHADSWDRVYPERKQVKIARLITREF